MVSGREGMDTAPALRGFHGTFPSPAKINGGIAPRNEPSPWLLAAWSASSFGRFLHTIGCVEPFALLFQRIQIARRVYARRCLLLVNF